MSFGGATADAAPLFCFWHECSCRGRRRPIQSRLYIPKNPAHVWRHLQTSNVVWKKNRNAYARLLLEQLRCGRLGEPFSSQPPSGPLPTLPKHLAYAFKPARTSGSPQAVAGDEAQAQQARAAPPALAQRQQQQHVQQQARLQAAQTAAQRQQQQLSATEQLHAYLGRADFRRAQYADERARATAAAAAEDSDNETEEYTRAGSLKYLPGTRMQLRGAEGRRVDRCGLRRAALVGAAPPKRQAVWNAHASRACMPVAGQRRARLPPGQRYAGAVRPASRSLASTAGINWRTWAGSLASWSWRRSWGRHASATRSWSGGWARWRACCASTPRCCRARQPPRWDPYWTPLTTGICRRPNRCVGAAPHDAQAAAASCTCLMGSISGRPQLGRRDHRPSACMLRPCRAIACNAPALALAPTPLACSGAASSSWSS